MGRKNPGSGNHSRASRDSVNDHTRGRLPDTTQPLDLFYYETRGQNSSDPRFGSSSIARCLAHARRRGAPGASRQPTEIRLHIKTDCGRWTTLADRAGGAGHSALHELIGTGDNILIGGFFAGPQTVAVTRVVFRAIGPSLAAFNVPQPMQDPTIELRNRNGDLIASNDDWETFQKAEIEATGLQPNDSRESAIVMTNFEPGPYTAIVRGKNSTTGVGLVEIFDVQN